jgi:two-component system LytT family sensor kinase
MRPLSNRTRRALLVFAAWTAVGIVACLQPVGSQLAAGRPLPRWDYLLSVLQSCWVWALATPFIFRATERFPLDRPSLRAVGAHLGVFTLAWVVDACQATATVALLGRRSPDFLAMLIGGVMACLLSYFAVLGLGHAMRFHRMLVERQVRAAELQAQLLRSQLTALQMQLRPHFLFNALNTVSGLVRTGERQRTLQVVAGLADLLRAVLRSEGVQEVPLRQELELVERYLRIERARFEDRLSTEVHVDPAAADALVPQLLLQPLVENAVHHGTSAEGEGRVEIRVRRQGDQLWLEVQDWGAGSAKGPDGEEGEDPGGIGLSNTRARLRHLYGEAHHLALRPSGEGHLAEVGLPFRRAAATPEAA